MGTDQGKTSNVNAALWMAALRGVELPAAGTTTFRPPYTPVSIGALAGRHTGARFRPTRRSPLHDWHVANGAVMIEAGPWLRPWYYRWAGESAAAAYLEEMRLVRGGVGVSDVSTLGKIDVQGPDAAEFLNRVYVNGFAKLPIGKARYGVMLNDDATVLDDGTTARFGETRFFHDHHDRSGSRGHVLARVLAADRVDGSARAGGLGHRSMGRHVGRRPTGPCGPRAGLSRISTSRMRRSRTWGCVKCRSTACRCGFCG